jgi:FixJ family two-component response regulator
MDTAGPTQLLAVVTGDRSVREALRGRLESAGYVVEAFVSAEEFLTSVRRSATGCLVLDVRSPGMSRLVPQTQLLAEKTTVPVISLPARPAMPWAAGRWLRHGRVPGGVRRPATLLRAIRSASKSQSADSKTEMIAGRWRLP